MKLAVFAATGRTGRHVVDQAVTAGHEVTAIARHPVGLPARVRTVTADLSMPDPPVLESALVGTDAVLSALGPRNSAEYGTTLSCRPRPPSVVEKKKTANRSSATILPTSRTRLYWTRLARQFTGKRRWPKGVRQRPDMTLWPLNRTG
ncbi:NAD(P)H-binding protein [Amycolatopsis sp.]|uniref:NAD(P)-dependent oxidoreductase n=1 Tax=Amycolatopsis sp. TaxID=37632 RepID=UPI003459439E